MDSQYLPIGFILKGTSYNYKIDRVLGFGAHGIVYAATPMLSGSLGTIETTSKVAIKELFINKHDSRIGQIVLKGNDSDKHTTIRQSFLKEAEILSKIKSPYIVKVLEDFEANGTYYFVMEYLEGITLLEFLNSNHHKISEQSALFIIYNIAINVLYLHDNNIMHLDLKPSNIICKNEEYCALIDFGISLFFENKEKIMKNVHIAGGSLHYAPIEQLKGNVDVKFTPTMDIYAIGAILFNLLTGKTPPMSEVFLHKGFPYDDFIKLGINKDIIKFNSWLMDVEPLNRPQSIWEIIFELHRLLSIASDTPIKNNHYEENSSTADFNFNDTLEMRNGLSIQWSNICEQHQKKQIRYIIDNMKIVCYKQDNNGKANPLMSLGEDSCSYVGNTGDLFNINKILAIILDLEFHTKLPFRLATKKELILNRTSLAPKKIITYSPEAGFIYYIETNHFENISSFMEEDTYDFQIVCDRSIPIHNGHTFYSDCEMGITKIFYDEIEPIGLGFYKVKFHGKWNVVTPTSTFLLPKHFDSISTIGNHIYPTGGPIHYYFGIIAKNNDINTFFSLSNHKFEQYLSELINTDIQERAGWT